MEIDILEGLKDIGYEDIDESTLQKSIQGGAKSVEFTKLIEWLTKELQYLYSLDEHVNAISSPADSSSFQMELSSFLKEIGCNYIGLTTGHINDRLQSKKNKCLLFDYLITEVRAGRMIKHNKPETDDYLQVTLNESSAARDLKNLLITLKFPKPPANIPASVLFGKVENKVNELIKKVPPQLIGKPMFQAKLTDKQWNQLSEIQKELHDEYQIRRKTLLTRLDVTIQSFEWSDRLKSKTGDIEASYNLERKKMNIEPNVKLSDILAAREDLAITEKTSSASVRRKTKSDINYVIIGMVPDRGGRPYEQEPPPPEMPSWQQRSNQGGPGQRGGFRGGQRGGGQAAGGGQRGGGQAAGGGQRGGGQSSFGRGDGGNLNRGYQENQQKSGYDGYNAGGNFQSGNYSSQRGGYQSSNSYTGYSASGGTGYNTSNATRYNANSTSSGTGYNTNSGTGYNTSTGTGYSTSAGSGYNASTGTRYNTSTGAGYNTNTGAGYNTSAGTGYNRNVDNYSGSNSQSNRSTGYYQDKADDNYYSRGNSSNNRYNQNKGYSDSNYQQNRSNSSGNYQNRSGRR